jgi:hypothetical protein
MPRPFYGFPTAWGNIKVSIVGHTGPASYTQVTTGTIPVVGGDVVYAEEFGLQRLSAVFPAGLSDSGTYLVQAIPITDSDYRVNGTSYRLRWVVLATGAEAAAEADLDAETIRLLGIGDPD